MADIRKRIVFHGRVQGVGFRYTAKYLAQSLGLTGWVRNEWDGTVTLEIQGREMLINKLLVGLNHNQFITIDWMDTKEIPVSFLNIEEKYELDTPIIEQTLSKDKSSSIYLFATIFFASFISLRDLLFRTLFNCFPISVETCTIHFFSVLSSIFGTFS